MAPFPRSQGIEAIVQNVGQDLSRYHCILQARYPDSKVHGANMGPTWVLSAPGRPHVGPMNLAIRAFPHGDIMAGTCFPHRWPFVRRIQWFPVDSIHKRPEIKNFDILFVVSLNKLMNKVKMPVIWDTMTFTRHHCRNSCSLILENMLIVDTCAHNQIYWCVTM